LNIPLYVDPLSNPDASGIISLPSPTLTPGQRYVVSTPSGGSLLGKATTHREIKTFKSQLPFNPVDARQTLIGDALMDPKTEMVVILGRSGTGKTHVSLVSGLEQVARGTYERLIIVKAMTVVGRGRFWGTTPGGPDLKMEPFIASLWDVLESSNTNHIFSNLRDKDQIEIVPMELLRGRDLRKCFIVVDEAQNMNVHGLLTTGTRVGKEGKIVLAGDINQIDLHASETSGLPQLLDSELFWQSDITSFMSLTKRMRSPICEIIEDALVPERHSENFYEVTNDRLTFNY